MTLIKKYKWAMLLFTLFIVGCNGFCDNRPYEWMLPYSVSPLQDTFMLGDTIHVSSYLDGKVWDRNNNKYVKLKDCPLKPKMKLADIGDTLETSPYSQFDFIAVNNFDFIKFSPNSYGLSYLQKGEGYQLDYKIILKDTGKFLLGHAPSVIAYEACGFEDKCGKTDPVAYAKLPFPDSSNIEILRSSPDPLYNSWVLEKPKPRFYDQAGFAFYVKPR